MTMDELQQRLSSPFSANEVEWRITRINKEQTRGLAVPYLDSRAVQNRLDSVVGPFNWRIRYIQWHTYVPKAKRDDMDQSTPVASQLCALAIYCEERKEWLEKQDGAENTDFESIKGGLSDSFKRAAVLWGIGRYLYSFSPQWASIDRYKQITEEGLCDLHNYYQQRLDELGLSTVKTQSKPQNSSVYQITEVSPVTMPDNSPAIWF